MKYDQPRIDEGPYKAGLTGDPQAAAAGVKGVRVVGGEPKAEMKKFMNEHKDFTK